MSSNTSHSPTGMHPLLHTHLNFLSHAIIVQEWCQEFSDGGLTLPMGGYNIISSTFTAKSLRKIVFHLPKGGLTCFDGGYSPLYPSLGATSLSTTRISPLCFLHALAHSGVPTSQDGNKEGILLTGRGQDV